MNKHDGLLGCDELGTESMFGTGDDKVSDAPRPGQSVSRKVSKKAKPSGAAATGRPKQHSQKLYSSPSRPDKVAGEVIPVLFADATGVLTTRYWRGDWYQYTSGVWEYVAVDDIQQRLKRELSDAEYADGNGARKPWAPNRAKISDLLWALRLDLKVSDEFAPPLVFDGNDVHDAGRIVPFRNGVYNLDTEEFSRRVSPKLFNVWALEFDYDPTAKAPEWGRVLDQYFAHDPKAKALLQEWFGYVISGRTDLQKMLLIKGPPRSGKGTVGKVLRELIGEHNSVSPSMSNLGSEFGTAQMIGKPLAMLEDSRDAPSRMRAATEKLLNISGEDEVQINRKNKDHWVGRLPARVMISSNEVPGFLDNSGAIISRFEVIVMVKSYRGKEDSELLSRLRAELPGIFNWAMDGYRRLVEQGRFTKTGFGDDALELMDDLAAPVAQFLSETTRYEVTQNSDDNVLLKHLHADYKQWCFENDVKPWTQQKFAKAVDARPGLLHKNTHVGEGKKARRIFGIRALGSISGKP